MNLVDYGRILWRRGWIVVLLALIAAGSAYLFSTQLEPIYRSSVKVLIVPARFDLSLTESSRGLLNNLKEYLDSTLIAQTVIDNLRLDMTPQQLKSKVTIAADQLSLTIQIDVDLASEEVANNVAGEWANQLVIYRNERNQESRREDRIDAQLQDNPTASLLQPRPTLNALAGAVLGVLLGGIIIFVLEYLESSIVRRRDDIERTLDIPVLADIPATER
jgi:capsular polysaccharide biosynthesis protein